MKLDPYFRKSSRDEGRSVARQQRFCQADSATEDFVIGQAFVDPDLSASRYARKDRPDYAALLDHIAAGKSEGIWLWEGTRGSRQMGEWIVFLDLCRDHRMFIRVFGQGGDDAQTYRSWIQRDREALIRMGMAAESEVEVSRSRTMAGNLDAAAEGRPTGPMADGYKREYGAPSDESRTIGGQKRRQIRQVIDEPRAQLYRWAAEGALNGVPLQFMARVLRAWSIPTASGHGDWTGHGLSRALLNPALRGHRVLKGEVVARNCWPAVIDEETGAALEKVLTTSGRRPHNDGSLKYMLSGALLCGACRRPMKGDNRQGKMRLSCVRPDCFRVSGPMDRITEVVSDIVVARLRRRDATGLFESKPRDNTELIEARRELKDLTDRQSELRAEAGKPGGQSIAWLVAAATDLQAEIDLVEKRIRILETPPALRGYDRLDLAARWDQYAVGIRRAVVLGLAEVILSQVGKGGRWSLARLGESRWRGDELTWGEHWAAEGFDPTTVK